MNNNNDDTARLSFEIVRNDTAFQVKGIVSEYSKPSIPGIKLSKNGKTFSYILPLDMQISQNADSVEFMKCWLEDFSNSLLDIALDRVTSIRNRIRALEKSKSALEEVNNNTAFFYSFLAKMTNIFYGDVLNFHIKCRASDRERGLMQDANVY